MRCFPFVASRVKRPEGLMFTAMVCGLAVGSFTAPAWAEPGDQIFKIQASDGEPFDYFGNSIASNADVVAVGGYGNSVNKGAVYLYDPQTGEEIAKITAKGGKEQDFFGFSVAIDDGILAVSAIGDSGNGKRSGAAYLIDIESGEELFKLKPQDGSEGDVFGQSIAIANGIVAIGAFEDGDNGPLSGSAYLFDVETGELIFKLLPDDGAENDRFGNSIAIDNGVVVVGAALNDDQGADSGSVYLFDAASGTQLTKLLPSGGRAGDMFGASVAMNNGIIAVGAHQTDDEVNGKDSGSVYLFKGANFTPVGKLMPDDGMAADNFGYSVALDYGLLAVGAHWVDDKAFDAGAVYLFDAYVGEQLGKLVADDGTARDHFGHAVAVNDGVISVGSREDDEDNGLDSGSAYIFDGNFTLKCLQMTIKKLIAGAIAEFTIAGGTPGAKAVIVYGTKPGRTILRDYGGYCATFGIQGVDQTKLVGGKNLAFDDEGMLVVRMYIPIKIPGYEVLFHAAQHDSCPYECMSELFEMVIQ